LITRASSRRQEVAVRTALGATRGRLRSLAVAESVTLAGLGGLAGLALGGWANPHADAVKQVGHLEDAHFSAEYFLTQVVSHHDRVVVDRFLAERARRKVTLPGIFGVFYYRSANPKTLATLKNFLPVPVEGLTQDFVSGASPDEVCARTIRALREAGAHHVYVSNLPVGKARVTLEKVMALADRT